MTEFFPPEGVSPAVAGGFVDHSVDSNDVLSLIPHLANKGYLRMEAKEKKGLLLQLRLPSYVGKYGKKEDTLYGRKAGLQVMDRIVAVDSTPVQFYDEIATVLKDHKNGEVKLTVERNGETLQLTSKAPTG